MKNLKNKIEKISV